jgi:hypothetical protein
MSADSHAGCAGDCESAEHAGGKTPVASPAEAPSCILLDDRSAKDDHELLTANVGFAESRGFQFSGIHLRIQPLSKAAPNVPV